MWTLKGLSERHVGGPTIAAAHFLRVISADKNQRLDVANNVKIKQPSPVPILSNGDKEAWAEKIRLATYGTVLASFIQGCNLIARQSKSQKWGINLADCISVWRAGCIIQAGECASDGVEITF